MNDKPVLRYLMDSIPWFSFLAGTDCETLKAFATYKCFGLLIKNHEFKRCPSWRIKYINKRNTSLLTGEILAKMLQ